MKRLKRNLSLLLVTTLIQTTAASSHAASCQDIKDACAETVRAADAYIDELKVRVNYLEQTTSIQDDLIAKLQDKHASDQAALNAWYRQPVTLFALGFIAGAVTITYVRK